ncbi:cytochrome P450 [Gloeopeniophorella convolvens]|nr:cytochrome P450 [Gloeopeniophorella convolvens]
MLFSAPFLDLLTFLCFVTVVQAIRDRHRRRNLPYPPGPPPAPIIGNLLDIPKEDPWLKYSEYAQKYGDIVCLRIFGRVIIILNSEKVAKDLFGRRGSKFSDRPDNTMFEMMGCTGLLAGAHYNDDFRTSRKFIERGMRQGLIGKYKPMKQARVRVLLSRILERPDDFEAHLDLFQGELLLSMTYGYEVQGHHDRMLLAPQEMNDAVLPAILPGRLLVNDLPLLRHIPGSIPWLSYKAIARIGQEIWDEVRYAPIEFVKGTAFPSLALENFEEIQGLDASVQPKAESLLIEALGSMYTAGADTEGTALMVFILAALLNPEVQRKAQTELDSVTARERLPTFEDRPSLLYVDAVCKEVLRWRPVAPLSIPHAVSEDDVYEGYFIPKGAVVIGNAWEMLWNSETYPEPNEFKPERFLNPDGSLRDDPTLSIAFGYGKRICPGRHFADTTLFIVVASLLSVFNVERKCDKEGNPLPVKPTFTYDLIWYVALPLASTVASNP